MCVWAGRGGGGGAQDKLNPATAGIRALLQADSYNPTQPIDLSKVERWRLTLQGLTHCAGLDHEHAEVANQSVPNYWLYTYRESGMETASD